VDSDTMHLCCALTEWGFIWCHYKGTEIVFLIFDHIAIIALNHFDFASKKTSVDLRNTNEDIF